MEKYALKLSLGCLLIIVAPLQDASAQQSCLSSLQIDKSKNVSFISLGSTVGDKLVNSMTCGSAEELRENLFLSGQAIDPNLYDDAAQLASKVVGLKEQLNQQSIALRSAQTRAAKAAALNSLKITLLGAGVAAATSGCVVSGTTCLAAFGGAVALIDQIDSTVKTAADLSQTINRAQSEIARLITLLHAIEAEPSAANATQGKLRYKAMFSEMCRSIKQQCQ